MAPTEQAKTKTRHSEKVDADLLSEFHTIEDARLTKLLHDRTHHTKLMVAKK